MGKTQKPGAIVQSWQRIETWLAANAKGVAKTLRKGAGEADLARLEERLGVTLPVDFKESCAIHDGQKSEADLIPVGYGTYFLLPLSKIPGEQKLWNSLLKGGEFEGAQGEPDEGVAAAWWHPGWVPFAANGGGDNLCLDLAPTPQGTVGQVIKVEHDNPERNLLAPSFAAWLQELAASLENGDLLDFLE
jgi:cell wall assembly regulator SMI1